MVCRKRVKACKKGVVTCEITTPSKIGGIVHVVQAYYTHCDGVMLLQEIHQTIREHRIRIHCDGEKKNNSQKASVLLQRKTSKKFWIIKELLACTIILK